MDRRDFIKGMAAMSLFTAIGGGRQGHTGDADSPIPVEDLAESDEKRLRIDAHTHLFAMDAKNHKCFVSETLSDDLFFKFLVRSVGVSEELTPEEFDIAYADKLARLVREAKYLDKAVIFALDARRDSNGEFDPATELMISNDWAIEACKRHPDVFLFAASVHPARADALDELDRCAKAGAVGVKWIPGSQVIAPSDRRYLKFYERMAEHGLVLSSHTGYEHTLTANDQSLNDPELLRLPLEVGVKVVACHSGTSGFHHRIEYFPKFARLVQEFENLYGDTAAITSLYRGPYRKRLLETPVVKERIIHGTDYPVPPMPIVWPVSIGPIKAAKLQFHKNPFDRDYLAKKLAGFPEEHFLRGHDVFLGNV